MKAIWKKLPAAATLAAAAVLSLGSTAAQAQGKTITLCWAAWDPANALVELSKDFTAQTKVNMKFEFVPWPNFADRMLNELNSKGKLCDLIIGDSQWIGGAAENHWYVKLNDFFAKEHITMADFVPATVLGYSEWPKNTPNYWALPAMADAVGWTYRKDWFSRPEIQAEFRKKYGRDLAPPKSYAELKQIAEFCGMHPLEVQAIADGEVAQGIVGYDPVANGQLTTEEIRLAEQDPERALRLAPTANPMPKRQKGARYTPVSKRNDRPDAIVFLLRNFPQLSDAQISKLLGTTKETIQKVRDRSHWNSANIKPRDPVILGLCTQTDLNAMVAQANERLVREGQVPVPAPAPEADQAA